jgi:hypothetical protein
MFMLMLMLLMFMLNIAIKVSVDVCSRAMSGLKMRVWAFCRPGCLCSKIGRGVRAAGLAQNPGLAQA